MRVPLAPGVTRTAVGAGWVLDLGGVASLIAGTVGGVAVGVGSYFYLRARGRESAETPARLATAGGAPPASPRRAT